MINVCKVDDSITGEDDERLFNNFSMKKYFEESFRESQSFLRNLISRTITSNIQPLAQIANYVGKITFHEDHYDAVMDAICQNLTFIEQNISFSEKSSFFGIKVNVLFLATFAKERMESKSVKNNQFTKLFFEKAGNKVISFILKPQYRTNESILMIAYELLSIFNTYPIHVLHIIGFMFCSHDRILRKRASRLLLGLKEKQLRQLGTLENVFQGEILSPKPQFTVISNFLKSYKTIGLAHKSSLLTILTELLHMCQKAKEGLNISIDDESGKDDIKVKDFIIQLLDYLLPDRDENRSFTLSDSLIASEVFQKQNRLYRFCPIPDYIISTAPEFWKVFEEYRPLINEILLKEFKGNKMIEVTGILGILLKHLYVDNFSSRLVSNYPECFSFEFRSTFFRQTQHEEIKFYNETEVDVDLDNLYESSYRQLHTKTPKEWKSKFLIKYLGSD